MAPIEALNIRILQDGVDREKITHKDREYVKLLKLMGSKRGAWTLDVGHWRS
jgi:hypothetical protein